jgi:NAD(P)-dependent dehydrogenase (short-subunit alcohol dehydrogenase family)
MTDPAQVSRAIDEPVATLGGVDVCVDITGATKSKVEDFTTQLWDAAIHYNLTLGRTAQQDPAAILDHHRRPAIRAHRHDPVSDPRGWGAVSGCSTG